MAAITSNTLLALILSVFFSVSSFAFDDYIFTRKAFSKKQYSVVIKTFLESRNKKKLLKGKKTLTFLAISAEKTKRYDLAYTFYYKIFFSMHKKVYKQISQKIDNGHLIETSDVSKLFKINTWKMFTSLYSLLKSEKVIDTKFKKRLKFFTELGNLLIELEFQEEKTDRLLTSINYHVEELNKKKNLLNYTMFADIISWQTSFSLIGAEKAKPIITNRGICSGVGLSYENYYTAFSLSSCFVVGLGNVSENSNNAITYQQENILGLGLKITPGFSIFVSEKKAEVGIKIPLFYLTQSLEDPEDYSIDKGSSFKALTSLYSKWPIGNYFLQTEFGKFIDSDLTMWSIGLGKKF